MKFILISPKNRTSYNFRGDLIKKIIASGYEVIVTGPNRDNVEKILELGAEFYEIPMNKNGVNPIKDLAYTKALMALFKKEKPDVILGYTSKPVIYASIAAKLSGVLHRVAMVTGAGYAFTAKTLKARVIKAIMSILYKIGCACANVVIFQNDDDKSEFVGGRLVSEKKCRVVNGSGVNMEKFSFEPYPENMTFLMVSRVMYSKGIREYLGACDKVKGLYPQTRFMLLGACENIQDSMSKEDLDDYIKRGVIEHFGETDTVSDYYKQCSVYVLPSYREGTPRTVLEAMSMSRPVITTDAPGCRGTVIDKESGYLVPVGDADGVAEAMIKFIKNPELVEKMGKKGYEHCKDKYDVNKVNDQMCRILKI